MPRTDGSRDDWGVGVLATALDPAGLIGRSFRVYPIEDADGFALVYGEPQSHGMYSIGADFAYGLPGRDFDAMVVLDKSREHETGKVEEAGLLLGHWGERADRVLYAAHRLWGEALIVGERQVGLMTLRKLWDEYACRRIYRPRDEAKSGRDPKDTLGYHAAANDTAMARLRIAVAEQRIVIHSKMLVDQMRKMVFIDRSQATSGIRSPDEGLKMRLLGGGSPDMVKALAYAWLGCTELVHYEPPAPKIVRGTMADVLGYAKLDDDFAEDSHSGWGGRRSR